MVRLMVHDMPVPLRTDEARTVRVGATRVPLDTVICAYGDGCTAEEIVERYPALSLPDVHALIAYYLTHRTEVEGYRRARESEAEELKPQVEALGGRNGVRARLIARQAARRGA